MLHSSMQANFLRNMNNSGMLHANFSQDYTAAVKIAMIKTETIAEYNSVPVLFRKPILFRYFGDRKYSRSIKIQKQFIAKPNRIRNCDWLLLSTVSFQ